MPRPTVEIHARLDSRGGPESRVRRVQQPSSRRDEGVIPSLATRLRVGFGKGPFRASDQDAVTRTMNAFLHEVRESTAALMFLLQGAHKLHSTFGDMPGATPGLELPGMALHPVLAGPSSEDFFGPGGTMAQVAYIGWMMKVLNSWENPSRPGLRRALDGLDVILPESQALGDLHRIRNDIVHRGGVATKKETGKCSVLKWFKVGDRIELNMNHVLDFLNQLGVLSNSAITHPEALRACTWSLHPNEQELSEVSPTPRIISVRVVEDPLQAPPDQATVGVSLVFENGVFGSALFQVPQSTAHRYHEAAVDSSGNLRFSTGKPIEATDLYRECLASHFQREPRIPWDLPGSAFQIRREV